MSGFEVRPQDAALLTLPVKRRTAASAGGISVEDRGVLCIDGRRLAEEKPAQRCYSSTPNDLAGKGPQMTVHTGRHFLQIPGPTNIPDRVLRAMDMPGLDHRGPEFAEIGFAVLAGMQRMFKTKGPVIIYPSSGTGAWEAAIVNVLQPGDKVLMCETGQFAVLWRGIADKFKLDVDFVPGDWRHGADLDQVEAKLAADKAHKIKAVCVVHNETSTGCVTSPHEVRKIMDRVKHPALLMVDTISGLGSMEYEHDAWGVDISVAGSQKGLMLPPGLGFNAVSEKALAVAKANPGLRSYWEWEDMMAFNKAGTFPYTPAINLLFGLREAVKMLEEEGLENVFARHKRHSEATRAAMKVWGLETQCQEQGAHSPALTGVRMPEGPRLRSLPQDRAGEFRHVARHRPEQGQGQGVPHRPYRSFQRSDADGHALGRRDGSRSCQGAAPHRRRGRRDGCTQAPRCRGDAQNPEGRGGLTASIRKEGSAR